MFRFVYDTESFENTFKLPNGSLFSHDCIIDLELLNDIAPKWIYSEGKPCAVGLLYENRMTIYVAETDDDKQFKAAVWEALQQQAKISKLYAFNEQYIGGVLKALFDGFSFPFKELAPIHGSGWTKDKCYKVLRLYSILSGDKEIYDNYGGERTLSVEYFAQWLETGDSQHLRDISQHILTNLVRQSLIHRHRDFFAKQYNLDSGGFETRARAKP